MIDQYLETQVMTASPHRLHLMVVEGAIRHATRAVEAIESENWESMHLALNSARDFVAELVGGLNAEQSPELVERLKSLFAFVIRNLMHADIERNPQRVHDALAILKSHRETWLELIESLHDPAPATQVDSAATGRCWET